MRWLSFVALVLIAALGLLACASPSSDRPSDAASDPRTEPTDAVPVPSADSAAIYARRAQAQFDSARFDAARRLWARSRAAATRQGDTRRHLYAAIHQADLMQRQDSSEAALALLHRVLDSARTAFSPPDTIIAGAMTALAFAQMESGAVPQALDTAMEALQHAQAASDRPTATLGASHHAVGTAYRRMGRLDSAATHVRAALDVRRTVLTPTHPKVASSRALLGIVHAQEGRHFASEAAFKAALDIEEQVRGGAHPNAATYYSNLGSVYRLMGRYEQAIRMHRTSIEILRAVGASKSALASSYQNLGNAYADLNDFASASVQHQTAIEYWSESYGPNHVRVGQVLTNRGIVLAEMGKTEEALSVLKRAHDVLTTTLGAEHYSALHVQSSIASTYVRSGRVQEGLDVIERVLPIYRARNAPLDLQLPALLVEGDALMHLGRLDEAERAYRTALDIQRDVSTRGGEPMASAYLYLAQVVAKRGRYDAALDYTTDAMNALRATTPSDYVSRPGRDSVEVLVPAEAHHSVLRVRAGLYRQRAAAATSDAARQADLESALAVLEDAFVVQDYMRNRLRRKESKLLQIEDEKDAHELALVTALDLHRLTGAATYVEDAFRIAESAKAALFLETLSEVDLPQSDAARPLAAALDSVDAQLRAYRRLLVQASTARSRDSSRIAQYEKQVQTLASRRSSLLERFRETDRQQYALRYDTQPATISELRATPLVDSSSVVVEYFTGADTLYSFALTSDTLIVDRRPMGTLREDVETLRQSIVERSFAPYVGAARAVYEQVLAPLGSAVDGATLTVIPDGVLHYVPFETLLTGDVPDADAASFADLPYLLRRSPIRYGPSATVLTRTLDRPRQAPARELLAMAPVDDFAGTDDADALRSPTLAAATRSGAPTPRAPDATPDSARGAETPGDTTPGAATPSDTTPSDTTRAGTWMPALPGTASEVKRVASLFDAQSGWLQRWFAPPATTYLTADATEDALKRRAGQFRYLHLATHSIVRADHPELTRVLLAPPAGRDREDGVLYLGEVYGLDLNADLVTLSACDTGLGRIAKGEGLIGLTRGFLHAGARSVMVSLWPVQDRLTADFMASFYRALLDGQTKPEAMRTAKLAMLEAHPLAARPYYWAGFVIAGAE